MLYREIIAVCSQIHTKHINTLCGQNFCKVTTGLYVVQCAYLCSTNVITVHSLLFLECRFKVYGRYVPVIYLCVSHNDVSATHSTVQYYNLQHSTVQYSTVQYSTAQHSTAQHITSQHSTVQYSTVQYNYF
jgi:adenine-specific DNA-methyltransferase